jgi:small multidrug resistance family-3 protein
MTRALTLLLLFSAALLEAGGDALIRAGLRSAKPIRIAFLCSGALLLFGYGCAVNTPNWDFGRLLGIYVVLFFVVAQLIGWLAFGQTPGIGVRVGGAFILLGGLIMSLSRA